MYRFMHTHIDLSTQACECAWDMFLREKDGSSSTQF